MKVVNIIVLSSLKRVQRNLNRALFDVAVILTAVVLGRDVRLAAQLAIPSSEDSASTGSGESKTSVGKQGAQVANSTTSLAPYHGNSPKMQVRPCLL